MSRFEEFKNQVSPVKAGSIVYKEDATNQIADMLRLCVSDATIDGVSLKQLVIEKGFMVEKTDQQGLTTLEYQGVAKEAYESILSEIFLKNIKGSKADKQQELSFLKFSFHQGGLMNPVSAPLQTTIEGMQFGAPKIDLHFVTTEKGFKVQEHFSAQTIMISPSNDRLLALTDNENFVMNDDDSPVIKAQATVEIDFSNKQDPAVVLESNNIEYGHDLAKKEFRPKIGFIQRFLDYLKRHFIAARVQVEKLDSQITTPTSEAGVRDDEPSVYQSKGKRDIFADGAASLSMEAPIDPGDESPVSAVTPS